jgi:hypothetical protein
MKITAKKLKQIIREELDASSWPDKFNKELDHQAGFEASLDYLEGAGGWPEADDPELNAAAMAVLEVTDDGQMPSKETDEYAALSKLVWESKVDEWQEANRVVRNLNNLARETAANAVGYAAKKAGREDHAALHQSINSK